MATNIAMISRRPVIALMLTCLMYSMFYSWDRSYTQRILRTLRRPSLAVASQVESPGNRTLGFGGIVVVSSGPSWRVDSLTRAAEFTGLNLDIPPQQRLVHMSTGPVCTYAVTRSTASKSTPTQRMGQTASSQRTVLSPEKYCCL
ncbi:hypothetical protein F4810DRAFT_713270 [Camillea tinctor]|nr:hypothetical protein F4810DRAFT_713270 [Camillea tinctor]